MQDGVVDRLVEPDEIHLVDREDDVADAHHRGDPRMPAGLRQHALARVDQDHRDVGFRRPGRHVARVLLVTGRIGGDEAAAIGGEEPVGDVDGDALLALRLQAVDQQGEIDALPLGAVLLRLPFERAQLVVEDPLRVVQQPSQQRGLSVVYAAAGDEAQRRLVALAFEVLGNVVGPDGNGQK